MARKKTSIRPALTPESREDQLINLAINLAEQQLMDGTASSQVLSHFLKLGSIKEKKELEMLEYQKELLKAKTESLKSEKKIEELYSKALDSMRRYSGQDDFNGEEEDDEYDY